MTEKIRLKNYPQGVPAEIDPDAFQSVPDLFAYIVGRFAAKPAFHNLGHTLSYADLDRLSRDFAEFVVTDRKLTSLEG